MVCAGDDARRGVTVGDSTVTPLGFPSLEVDTDAPLLLLHGTATAVCWVGGPLELAEILVNHPSRLSSSRNWAAKYSHSRLNRYE